MPSLAAYRDKTRELVYPISEDSSQDIKVQYFRGRITPSWVAEFNSISEDANLDVQLRGMCRLFCEVTASWNFTETDDPGSPMIPITTDDVMRLGMALIGGLLRGYIAAVQDPEVAGQQQPEPSPLPLRPGRRGSMAG